LRSGFNSPDSSVDIAQNEQCVSDTRVAVRIAGIERKRAAHCVESPLEIAAPYIDSPEQGVGARIRVVDRNRLLAQALGPFQGVDWMRRPPVADRIEVDQAQADEGRNILGIKRDRAFEH
jgi:hypothetical protein